MRDLIRLRSVRVEADDGADDRADGLAAERGRAVHEHDRASELRGFERRRDAGDAGAEDADVGLDGLGCAGGGTPNACDVSHGVSHGQAMISRLRYRQRLQSSSCRPRVRFAPSPTGYLHVGGARTALFNWLFARRHGGVFVLRIEDTDVERSSRTWSRAFSTACDGSASTGTRGRRSTARSRRTSSRERLDRYRAMAERLVADGHAYYCYCTPDELKAQARSGRGEPAAGGNTIARAARLTADDDRRARAERRAARRPLPRARRRRRGSTISSTVRSSSTTRTSRTSSSSAPMATRPTSCPSCRTMWR